MALALKLTYIFGWLNIAGAILVILSCRCIPIRLPKPIAESKAYAGFYRYHCYYWIIFLGSVIVHAIFAMAAIGNPFK